MQFLLKGGHHMMTCEAESQMSVSTAFKEAR